MSDCPTYPRDVCRVTTSDCDNHHRTDWCRGMLPTQFENSRFRDVILECVGTFTLFYGFRRRQKDQFGTDNVDFFGCLFRRSTLHREFRRQNQWDLYQIGGIRRRRTQKRGTTTVVEIGHGTLLWRGCSRVRGVKTVKIEDQTDYKNRKTGRNLCRNNRKDLGLSTD